MSDALGADGGGSGAAAGGRRTYFLYCRVCRQHFPVALDPATNPKLKCLCGYRGALESDFNLFATKDEAEAFRIEHNDMVRAAKEALRANNINCKDSGRFVLPFRISDVTNATPDPLAELIMDGKGGTIEGADEQDRDEEHALRDAVLAATTIFERHDALSNLVEFYYVRRELWRDALEKCVRTCNEDIALVPTLIAEARKRRAGGVKLKFSSFKHLAAVHEERDENQHALDVCKRAQGLGIPGYKERIEKLEALVRSGISTRRSVPPIRD